MPLFALFFPDILITYVFCPHRARSYRHNNREEDARKEWLIYQVAFLWHGLNPPTQSEHWNLMTRQIEDTKMMLHNAVDDRQLQVTREIRVANGVTRYVSRDQLRKFAESIGQKPAFLFPESRTSP